MSLLTFLKASLPSYPNIKLSELETVKKKLESQLPKKQNKLNAIETLSEHVTVDEIDIIELAKQMIKLKPSHFSFNFFLDLLHEIVDETINPMEILSEIIPDSTAIFSAIVIFLIQKDINADAIIHSAFISNWFFTNFRELAVLTKSFKLLEALKEKKSLKETHKRALETFLSLASTTQVDVAGIGKYTLNGGQSDGPIAKIPFQARDIAGTRLSTVPDIESLNKIESLFDYDFSELKKALAEKDDLLKSLNDKYKTKSAYRHRLITEAFKEYKRKPDLKYHYLFLEIVPKISDEDFLSLYRKKDQFDFDKELPIRIVADYLTAHQISLLFSDGDLWTCLDQFYPAKVYINEEIIEKIMSTEMTLSNIRHVINAALNEPALGTHQETILYKAFLFLSEHGKKDLIIDHAAASITYQQFTKFPKSIEWAMALNEKLKAELAAIIKETKTVDLKTIQELKAFKIDQVDFLGDSTHFHMLFPTQLQSDEQLMGFIIEVHFQINHGQDTFPSLLKSLFESDGEHITQEMIQHALYYCLASTTNADLQKAIISYVENQLGLKNWRTHSIEPDISFIDMVLLNRNVSVFENHYFDNTFSDESRAVIIERLNNPAHLIKVHPLLCFADHSSIIKELWSCYPLSQKSRWCEENEFSTALMNFIAQGHTLHAQNKNGDTLPNTLDSIRFLLSEIPEEKRFAIITKPIWDSPKDNTFTMLEQALYTGPDYVRVVLDALPKEQRFNAFKLNDDFYHEHMTLPKDQPTYDAISASFRPNILFLMQNAIHTYKAISEKIKFQAENSNRSSWFLREKKIDPLPEHFITELFALNTPEETIRYLYDFLNKPENHRLLRESILVPGQDFSQTSISNQAFAEKLEVFREHCIKTFELESLPEVDLDYEYVKPFVIPGFSL